MCQKANTQIKVVADASSPSGVLGNMLEQFKFEKLLNTLDEINSQNAFEIQIERYHKKDARTFNRKQFGKKFYETHCHRGYPIVGSMKQFFNSDSEYILHIDCDMLFYERPSFSWILEGIKVMEKNEDVLCVLPRGGPPRKDGLLKQGSTTYMVDEKRGLYLFKNFTSRHYLIHRERFLNLLPLKPLWLSWREPIKSTLWGTGKMLCWEAIVERAVENSSLWRADLMNESAWSVHCVERSTEFLKQLPRIICRLENGNYPERQAGHFDLLYHLWK